MPPPACAGERVVLGGGAVGTADGLVADERAVLDGERTGGIQDAPTKALVGSENHRATCCPGSPDGPVAGERTVGKGHHHSKRTLVIDGAAVSVAVSASGGQVAGEGGVADGRGRGFIAAKSRVVLDGTANAVIRNSGIAWGVGTNHLIVDKRTVVHLARVSAPKIVDASALASTKEGGAVTAPHGFVARERGGGDVGDAQIQQAPAEDVEVGAGGRLVVDHRTAGEVQGGTGVVENPAAAEVRRQTFRSRSSGHWRSLDWRG